VPPFSHFFHGLLYVFNLCSDVTGAVNKIDFVKWSDWLGKG